MDPMVKCFLLGCVGALAPEIVRLWTIAKNKERFTWTPFYIIMSLAFALLGGTVAVLMGAGNARSAFYTGVSTPLVISTGAKSILAAAKKKKKVKGQPPDAPAPLSRLDSFLEAL